MLYLHIWEGLDYDGQIQMYDYYYIINVFLMTQGVAHAPLNCNLLFI